MLEMTRMMDVVVKTGAAERALRHEKAELKAAERRAERERPGPKWFVVQCVGLSDKQIIDTLARYDGVETWSPKTVHMKRLPRRNMSRAQRLTGHTIEVPQEVPLFPRYLFVKVDTRRPGWGHVFTLPGVGGLVCNEGRPVFMSAEQMDYARSREINGAISGDISLVETFEKDGKVLVFDVGQALVVDDGPFRDFKAVVERPFEAPINKLDPNSRIRVAIALFGRVTSLELAYWQVKKTSNS